MKLSEVGEKSIIANVIRSIFGGGEELLPLNDDSQLYAIQDGVLAITTDRTPSNLTVRRKGLMGLHAYGRYSVISNLSDLAAIGARPVGYMLNVAAPPDMELDDFQEVLRGARDGLAEYGIAVGGGDCKEGTELSLVGVALGIVDQRRALTRSNCRPGDDVFISTSRIGHAAAALRLIGSVNDQIVDDPSAMIALEALTNPSAQIELGRYVSNQTSRAGAIDNTDGIYASLLELSVASNVGFAIEVPIDDVVLKLAKRIGSSPIELAMGAGGDFSLIIVSSEIRSPEQFGLVHIGRCTESGIAISGLTPDQVIRLGVFEHFNQNRV